MWEVKCFEKPILDLMNRGKYQTTWRWGSRGRQIWGQLTSRKYEFWDYMRSLLPVQQQKQYEAVHAFLVIYWQLYISCYAQVQVAAMSLNRTRIQSQEES